MIDILKNFFDYLISIFWDLVSTLLVALLSVIPVPDWAYNVGPAFSTMAEISSYPLWLTGFDIGVPIVTSAMAIRFFIRRIPGIG